MHQNTIHSLRLAKEEEPERKGLVLASVVAFRKRVRWYPRRTHTRASPDWAPRNHLVRLLEMAFLRNTPVGPLLYLFVLENGLRGTRKFMRDRCMIKNELWEVCSGLYASLGNDQLV